MSKTQRKKMLPAAVAESREASLGGGMPLDWRENVLLYSTAAFDGSAVIPQETVLFNYAQGQTVSGAGDGAVASNAWHTNMRVARSLPSPEIFVCDRVRAHVVPMVAGTSGVPTPDTSASYAATGSPSSIRKLAADTMALLMLHLRVEFESKRYIDAPLWMFPSNVGFGGLVNYSMANALTGNQESTQMAVEVPTWQGEGWRFGKSLPPILTSNTVVDVRLLWQHAGTAISMQADRYLQVILQGRHGRAVR